MTIGDRQLTANLVATEELDDSHYYRGAVTDLGEISIVHGGELDLTIRTIHIASPDAATMQLERLELQRF